MNKEKSPQLTCFDVSQGVNEHHNEVSDCIQPGSSDIQNPVVGVIVEGVPERIPSKVLIGWNLLS